MEWIILYDSVDFEKKHTRRRGSDKEEKGKHKREQFQLPLLCRWPPWSSSRCISAGTPESVSDCVSITQLCQYANGCTRYVSFQLFGSQTTGVADQARNLITAEAYQREQLLVDKNHDVPGRWGTHLVLEHLVELTWNWLSAGEDASL